MPRRANGIEEVAGVAVQRAGVRSRRSGEVVVVTAAAGAAGSAVVTAFLRRVGAPSGPRRVIAVDTVRGSEQHATWRVADLTDPGAAGDVLRGADVVVHVAASTDLQAALELPTAERRGRAVRTAQAVATAAAAVGARRLVVVSSAMVLGAGPDNPVPLPDDATQRAGPDDGLVGDLLEVETVLARVPGSHPALALTVLRPAALAGDGVDSVVTRHFEAPRLLTVRGESSRWQFCHLEDLGEAVAHAVEHGLDGSLTVGCEGALLDEDVERLSGMRRLEVPAALAFATAERLHRIGVLPMPGSDLAYVVYPWVVGSQRLRESGWTPRHDNESCLAAVLQVVAGRRAVAGRRLDRRDAALGAAGAAVALVGTAAVVRQARARQGKRRRPTG